MAQGLLNRARMLRDRSYFSQGTGAAPGRFVLSSLSAAARLEPGGHLFPATGTSCGLTVLGNRGRQGGGKGAAEQ